MPKWELIILGKTLTIFCEEDLKVILNMQGQYQPVHQIQAISNRRPYSNSSQMILKKAKNGPLFWAWFRHWYEEKDCFKSYVSNFISNIS